MDRVLKYRLTANFQKRIYSALPPPYEYEFKRLPIGIIIGYEAIRKGLEAGRDLDELEASWQEDLKGFLAIRKQYLLY
jgi:uncharacterized protein YbbC (DUF1343 family)